MILFLFDTYLIPSPSGLPQKRPPSVSDCRVSVPTHLWERCVFHIPGGSLFGASILGALCCSHSYGCFYESFHESSASFVARRHEGTRRGRARKPKTNSAGAPDLQQICSPTCGQHQRSKLSLVMEQIWSKSLISSLTETTSSGFTAEMFALVVHSQSRK